MMSGHKMTYINKFDDSVKPILGTLMTPSQFLRRSSTRNTTNTWDAFMSALLSVWIHLVLFLSKNDEL